MKEVTKASSVLGQICPEAILSKEPIPKQKSMSEKKARIAVNVIAYFHVNGGDLGIILDDLPKCERN